MKNSETIENLNLKLDIETRHRIDLEKDLVFMNWAATIFFFATIIEGIFLFVK